jgi:hypothetical protein
MTGASVAGSEMGVGGSDEASLFGDEAPPPLDDAGSGFSNDPPLDDFGDDGTSFDAGDVGGGEEAGGGGGGLFDMISDIFSED